MKSRSLFFPLLVFAAIGSLITTHLFFTRFDTDATSQNPASDPNQNLTILYLHGGSYLHAARLYHYDFLHNLDSVLTTDGTTVKLVAPDYPLAPRHDYQDAYAHLDNLYPKLRAESDQLILMGDSAGGGLALAYTEYLIDKNDSTPDALILISPWLDLTLENSEMKHYEKTDTTLNLNKLKAAAKAWAGQDKNGKTRNLKDPKLSPLFGSVSRLPKTLLFAGDQELFRPDIERLASRLNAMKVDYNLIIGQDQQHIYPLYPANRTAAIEQITNFLKNS